jgi:DNA mismatch endonuclease (patch repair protein)
VVDIVDKATRSRMMSGIRGKDTLPELRVRRFLHARGFRFRLHSRKLPGRPDLVLTKHAAVIFVHGCFWHRHAGCRFATQPASNALFWRTKFEQNVARDRRKARELGRLGWRVFVVWECRTDERSLARLAEQLAPGGDARRKATLTSRQTRGSRKASGGGRPKP